MHNNKQYLHAHCHEHASTYSRNTAVAPSFESTYYALSPRMLLQLSLPPFN